MEKPFKATPEQMAARKKQFIETMTKKLQELQENGQLPMPNLKGSPPPKQNNQ